MRYELSILSGNTTTVTGDVVVVSLSSKLRGVSSVVGLSVGQSPSAASDVHDLDVRWSRDGMSWSAWTPYYRGSTGQPTDPFPGVVSGGDFYLNVRATRAPFGTGAVVELRSVVLDFEQSLSEEAPVTSPFVEDPCSASACLGANQEAGIVMPCDSGTVWRPYDMVAPAVKMYEDLSCVLAEMYGHCVRYFRVAADKASGDAVLKEYSVFDAVDVKDIKVLVRDNEFPDNGFSFTPFDMDFQEGLEVHILRSHFESAFGQSVRPQEKDFLYFPLLDRLFEVHSTYLKRDFMQAQVYHRVMLYKWQDRDNVMRDRADQRIDEYVDGLTLDFEETLRGPIEEQSDIVTKPLQYRTISVGGHDHVRSQMHEDLLVVEREVENYFTLVSKYHYDLSTVPTDEPALVWKYEVASGPTSGMAITAWVASKGSTVGTFPLLVGQTAGGTGLSVHVVHAAGPSGQGSSATGFVVWSGGASYSFTDVPGMTGEWRGVVLNVMPEFGQVQLSVWRMRPASEKTTNLSLVYSSVLPYAGGPLDGGSRMWAPGGPHLLTNLRVWTAPVEEEKQPLLLNQYVVRDSHLASLVDNAVPPLRMPRTYAR